jgi:hypothetical protein
MSFLACKSAATTAGVVALLTSISTAALAQDTRTLANNEGILIDGKALTVTSGRARDDVTALLGNLGIHPLGPGAIVFRSGDKLYVADGSTMGAAQAMYDPASDRQRSYGGLDDDRQRSYGGFYDSAAEWRRQADRQQSYGGFYDSAAESRRQADHQQSYGGFYDPDYANYRLKKAFSDVWGTTSKK